MAASVPVRKQTIYDVAARAGASPSTVSAVLSGSWRSRRISATTADRVSTAATELGYRPNLQARGLRQARSGLVGMILPEHENRFFSQLSQSFSTQARARGLLPAIIATRRDPDEEARSIGALLGHSTDGIVVAGASNPERVSRLCRSADLRHVFVDQPCNGAPSVVTDNEGGMALLAETLADETARRGVAGDGVAGEVVMLGGDADPATQARIRGFRAALRKRGFADENVRVIACGYGPGPAQEALIELRAEGRLPAVLAVNSITAFEGALRVLSELPEEEVAACTIGCFDYSPFLSSLRFPVWMVRQRAEALIEEAFGHLDAGGGRDVLRTVPVELLSPRGPGRP